MTHIYKRTTFKPDGSQHIETCEVTSEWVAMTGGTGAGGRCEMLALINRWNRIGLSAIAGSPCYIFTLES